MNGPGGDTMEDNNGQRQPMKIEKKIGTTTYIVTSHFQEQGSTAVEKIKCLIDNHTKSERNYKS